MKKRAFIVLIFVGLFPITIQGNTGVLVDKALSLDYISHLSIDIDEDSDFVSYAFPGTGTLVDPYIIENYNITGSEEFGIRIFNITQYFIIRNCFIKNQTNGLLIQQVSSGRARIENNICNNNFDEGILVEDCGEVVIEYNFCHDNYGGIGIDNCTTSTITGNICTDNKYFGIELRYSPNSIFRNNTANNNSIGAYIYESDFADVSNNTCMYNSGDGCSIVKCENSICFNNSLSYNEIGLDLIHNLNSEISNNTMIDNERQGMDIGRCEGSTLSFNRLIRNELDHYEYYMDSYYTYTLINNTVNDLPYGFFLDLRDEVITEEYGQILLVNCSRTTIDGQILVAIRLQESHNCTITDNRVEYGEYGIILQNSESCEILGNTIVNQYFYGLYTENSDYTEVRYNTIDSCSVYAFELRTSPFSEFVQNTIQNCWVGYFWDTDVSTFSQNSLTMYYGIAFEQSTDLVVEDNNFYQGGFAFSQPSLNAMTYTWNNNLINGVPSMIFYGLNDTTLTEEYAQIMLINCHNVIIEDQFFTTITDAIALRDCENIVIRNCEFIDGLGDAIYVQYSSYIDINHNLIDNFRYGIIIREMTPYIDVSYNRIINTRGVGISLSGEYCEITYNHIQNNTGYGIFSEGGENCIIHHNNFIENNLHEYHPTCCYGTAQAYDMDLSNTWYDVSTNEGNYFYDWNGTGSYILDGGNEDPYPFSTEILIFTTETPTNGTTDSTSLNILFGLFTTFLVVLIRRRKKGLRKIESK